MEKEMDYIFEGNDVILKDLDYNSHTADGSSVYLTPYLILMQDLNNPMGFYSICETSTIDKAVEICKALSLHNSGRKFYISDCDLYEDSEVDVFEYCGLDTVIEKEN